MSPVVMFIFGFKAICKYYQDFSNRFETKNKHHHWTHRGQLTSFGSGFLVITIQLVKIRASGKLL
jgi:hypothetical protein